MKKATMIAALLFSTVGAFAQNWTLDKSHSNLGFTVTHMMLSEVDGKFQNFDVKMTSSKPDFTDAQIDLTADVSSINTNQEKRDGHLKSADFFDAAKYPTLAFKSKSISKVSGNKYKLMGDLTMHGVTKPVTLDAVITGPVTNPQNKKTLAGFKVTGEVKRADFTLGTIPAAVVSDEIAIRATGELVKAN
ncbi:YceI family protein [Spirosoma fluviale]|uniref:Polyisoprenoid-binding protein YceI n=1 Tax=Spirosoma fluviale TaxID=1597977 RepID=A0A286F4S9_9BACT|nr:YceI family protein [Spirosoma fluviale]SOD78218.1 Polyisoprenoid-binding protein YceI [Spirosoma fluviale]